MSGKARELLANARKWAQSPRADLAVVADLLVSQLADALDAALSQPAPVREAVEALPAEFQRDVWAVAREHDMSPAAADAMMRLLASLRERPTDGGWLPIDSAPKDGSHVLLARASEWSSYGYYEAERYGWWQANTHWTDASDGQCYPTHWQPLPASPSSSTGEVG